MSKKTVSTPPPAAVVPTHDDDVVVVVPREEEEEGTGEGRPSFCDSHVVSLSVFFTDLSSGHLPNYAFVTPNVCDDAHSCPLSVGDEFLSDFVPKITSSSSFSHTAIFIVYDEGNTDLGFDSAHGGHVVCILVSPFSKKDFTSTTHFSHYSLLHTVEFIFGLGTLGRNDAAATIMSDMFTITV